MKVYEESSLENRRKVILRVFGKGESGMRVVPVAWDDTKLHRSPLPYIPLAHTDYAKRTFPSVKICPFPFLSSH